MKIKYLLLCAIAGAVITADQLTKMWVLTHLEPPTEYQAAEDIVVIPGFFNVTHVHNTGAAFGIFARGDDASQAKDELRRIFFLSMPPIALLVILALMRTFADSDRAGIVALSSVFGGAIGNYIDRLRLGHVVDFLDFHVKGYHWPAFNVADIGIVVGVGILIHLEFSKFREPTADVSP
ncbi:MAG: signal peptidase II [Bdellovibrionaceae bacterium]|nr:signal peptidase II [Pseudobdellovibrionaceae bacterium]